jgi:hypothetical protein
LKLASEEMIIDYLYNLDGDTLPWDKETYASLAHDAA